MNIDLESYLIPLDEDYALEMYASYEELVEEAYILESAALEFEHELAYMIATEAVNGEDSNISSKASAISSKFKSGFNKLKNGKKKNDQKMIKEGQDEVNEASDELKEAESEASTPEEKKKLSTAAKVGIGVGGAALVGLLTFLGIKNKDKIQALISKLKRDKGDSPSETASTMQTVANVVSETPLLLPAHGETTPTKRQREVMAKHEAQQTQKSEGEPIPLPGEITLTERQQKAQAKYEERQRKKELKNWAILRYHSKDDRPDYDADEIRDWKAEDPESYKGSLQAMRRVNRYGTDSSNITKTFHSDYVKKHTTREQRNHYSDKFDKYDKKVSELSVARFNDILDGEKNHPELYAELRGLKQAANRFGNFSHI